MKHRDFIYTGDSVPKIDRETQADFITHYQRAILLTLVKRNVLSRPQCERCVEELERRPNRTGEPNSDRV